MIRKACIGDARTIQKLLSGYAENGQMLERSLSNIYEAIRDFYVYIVDDEIAGVACLQIWWEDLAEVRSLAVGETFGGLGIGRQLVQACLDEAAVLGLSRVFALTYQDSFFRKLGFFIIEKSALPQKIWGDCMQCSKFPDCDEIAMIRMMPEEP